MSNKHNGLITKIWGSPLWMSLHCITFGYPIEPTQEEKNFYKIFFISLGNVLPCIYCKNSYNDFIRFGDTIINDDMLKNRGTLTYWLYKIHERVNNKLKITYKTDFNDVVNKYESFRAKCSKNNPNAKGCVMPLYDKSKSYILANYKEAPLIPLELIKRFTKYAEFRGIDFSNIDSYNDCFYFNKYSKKWIVRNYKCIKIINNMKTRAKPSIEISGKFIGLPTLEELLLLSKLSSSLNEDELLFISNNVSHYN
jgi:hypothetical protein